MVRKYFVFHNSLILGTIHTCTSTFRTKKQNREWLLMVTMIWRDKQWISMKLITAFLFILVSQLSETL